MAASVHALVGHAGAPPIPAAGETVTWTLASSPYQVAENTTIPDGGTVVVEPGVLVEILSGVDLIVEGTVQGAGTLAQPIRFRSVSIVDAELVLRGTFDLDFAIIDCRVAQSVGGELLLDDSTITAGAFFTTAGVQGETFVRLERCTIQDQSISIVGQVVLRDIEFEGQKMTVLGYPDVRGFTSDGGQLELYAEQPRRVDGLSITNAPGPALVLRGGVDFLVVADTGIAGNQYPVALDDAGLDPASSLPGSGNLNDAILGGQGNFQHKGRYTWPNLGLPYDQVGAADYSGILDVHPGVTIRLGSSGALRIRTEFFKQERALRGLPGQPIVLEQLVPGQDWLSLAGIGGMHLFEHLVIDGAGVGIAASQATVYANETTIRNSQIGLQPSGLGGFELRGSRLLSNATGAITDMSAVSSTGLDLTGWSRPNLFVGNTIAVDNVTPNSISVPAEGNWWNAPSGPFNAISSPSGAGDPVSFQVDTQPFREVLPDLSDVPPVVRLEQGPFLAEPGSVQFVSWEASDDVAIVSQDVLLDLTGGGAPDFQPIATGLAPEVRGFEFVVPDIGFNFAARPQLLRVVVTDSAGNTSFDQISFRIPQDLPLGSFQFTTDFTGPFAPHEFVPLCWTALGVPASPLRTYLLLDGNEQRVLGPSGNAGTSCTFADLVMPYTSTDLARVAVISDGNGNVEEWFFSDYFSIRPNGLLGDAPPVVALTTPVGGEVVAGGDILPIAWTASDDEGLHEFRVQFSLDGGRTWQTSARGLSGGARSHGWTLPDAAAATSALVRVVAVDASLQISSSTTATALQVVPGVAGTCQESLGFDGPGNVDLAVCGDPLETGGVATLTISGAPPGGLGFLVVGLDRTPTPFLGGTVVPVPAILVKQLSIGAAGQRIVAPISGGGGPVDVFAQFLALDPSQPGGVALSNALRLEFLP